MSCPQTGPCSPYVTSLELCCLVSGGFEDPCLNSGDPVSSEIIDNAILAASEVLWTATGRQFGLCTVTIRPCKKTGCDPCPDGGGLSFFNVGDLSYGSGYPWVPVHTANGWINVSCPCSGSCGCASLCTVQLPYPVCCINEVMIDGVVVPPEEYRVDDFRRLVRLTDDCWPECQDLTLADTEEGTFSITVTYGRPVPSLIKLATAALACEFIKSCSGQPCQLPQRMSSMTRQGVTVGFLDTMQFLGEGFTGVYLVDLAIKKFNPKGLLKQASVFSPDVGKKWQRGTWNDGEPCLSGGDSDPSVIDGGGP